METPKRFRRRHAARHLLHPRRVRDSMAFARQPSLRNSVLAGVQSALTAAIALPLVWLSPWSHLIGFAALGALVALFGRFAPERRRNRILLLCGLCQVLAVLSMSLLAYADAPFVVQLAFLALGCGIFLFVSLSAGFGPPGALIFVFAAAASMTTTLSLQQLVERTAATAIIAVLAWVICAASERLRHYPTAERPLPADPVLSVGGRLMIAGRAVLGGAIAVFASYLLGAHHPAWAAMGALAVLQGTHLHINMHRALQRMAGTVVGALLAWVVLMQDPSVWTIIVALVVLQIVTETVIGSNYAIGQVLVTPMALLMTHLAAPQSGGAAMAPERIMDTVLGAAVGIVVAVLLSSLEERRRLAEHHARQQGP